MDGALYEFEAIEESLPYVPLAARRVLDASGRKLSLEGWTSLQPEERWRVALAGAELEVPADAATLVDRAMPPPTRTEPNGEPNGLSAPSALLEALGANRPLDEGVWKNLRPLDRYALVKCIAKPEKLARAYDEIVRRIVLSHLMAGKAHMVDVGRKAATARRAVASAWVWTTPAVVESIARGGAAKGDVLAVSRTAGILAAKRTPELVPLCHPVQTTRAGIEFDSDAPRGRILVRATVEAFDRTGVEMEALMAASVAALTIYDMIKSADRWASIESLRLEAKSGGKSGESTRPSDRGGQ